MDFERKLLSLSYCKRKEVLMYLTIHKGFPTFIQEKKQRYDKKNFLISTDIFKID